MQLTAMLDLYFPKQELTPQEYLGTKAYRGDGFIVYNGQRSTGVWAHQFNILPHHEKVYELYDGDHDYPFAKLTPYEIISVYDVSDTIQVRKFLQAYIIEATDGEIDDVFNGLF